MYVLDPARLTAVSHGTSSRTDGWRRGVGIQRMIPPISRGRPLLL